MLTPPILAQAVARIAAEVATLRDTLNAADRALGDGDTGMTVADIVGAWQAVDFDEFAQDVGGALGALGRAASKATGSSLGAVTATGLRAAGRAVAGQPSLDRAGVIAALRAATAAITERSGAQAGDKSVLDTLLTITDALAASDAGTGLGAVARDAALRALDDFRPRESRLGRARMFGARSVGSDDPGMLAAARLLQAVAPGGP